MKIAELSHSVEPFSATWIALRLPLDPNALKQAVRSSSPQSLERSQLRQTGNDARPSRNVVEGSAVPPERLGRVVGMSYMCSVLTRDSEVVLNRPAPSTILRTTGAAQPKGLAFATSLSDHPAWRRN